MIWGPGSHISKLGQALSNRREAAPLRPFSGPGLSHPGCQHPGADSDGGTQKTLAVESVPLSQHSLPLSDARGHCARGSFPKVRLLS